MSPRSEQWGNTDGVPGRLKTACLGLIWVFPKLGVPQNGWFIVEIHIEMDDLGENPPFSETPIYPPEDQHGTYSWRFGRSFSFLNRRFVGSCRFIFQGVVVLLFLVISPGLSSFSKWGNVCYIDFNGFLGPSDIRHRYQPLDLGEKKPVRACSFVSGHGVGENTFTGFTWFYYCWWFRNPVITSWGW